MTCLSTPFLGTGGQLFHQCLKILVDYCIKEYLSHLPVSTPFLGTGEQLFQHDPKWYLKFCEVVNNYVNIGVPFMRGLWNLPMPYRR